MFLVNWLATHFFARLDEPFPDEDEVSHLGPEWESSLAAEEDLDPEERTKLTRVKKLWRNVGVNLGVSHPKGVRFAVQRKQGMQTSVAIWHRGSPTIVIPVEYLSRMVFEGETKLKKSSGFDRSEWATWSRFIDNSPDHVEEMVDYTERFSKKLPRNKLRKLASRYGNLMSQVEFEAEMAHEFGHVHARHLNPRKGGRLSKFLRTLVGIGLPIAAFVAATGLCLFFRSFTGGLDLSLSLLCGAGAALFVRTAFTDHIMRKTVAYVRKQWEHEADAIAASSQRYCAGNVRLYKKDILIDIIKDAHNGDAIESLSSRVFKETDYHPSDGDRLHFFLGRMRRFEGSESPAIKAQSARALQ